MPSGLGTGGNSGSHGSSGGGHFGSGGGGSSSSGGGFGGGGRRGGSFVGWYTRPRVVIIAGRRYYSRPTQKGSSLVFLFTFLMVVTIFVLFFGLTFFINAQNYVNKVKKDYEYYQQMIISAEADPSSFVKTATITSRDYNTTAKKWYFNYTLKMANGQDLNGYTFCLYSQQEIFSDEYNIGSQIEVAVNNPVVDIYTDSVPLDYKDMPIERDGLYTHYLKNKNISIGVMIGAGVGFVAFIIAQVVVGKKVRELTPADVQNDTSTPTPTQNNTSADNTNSPKNSYENETTYCPYCGERITKGTKKCPKCKADL